MNGKLQTVLNIYLYNDYRLFLKDYFEREKKRSKAFSMRYFARRAGFSSHSFCGFLIRGERNLSLDAAERVAAAMSLKGKSAEFFKLLVRFNQAKTSAEKEQLFKEVNLLRRNTTFYKLNQNQYTYFEEWYFPVIREIAAFADWKEDYAVLGKLCEPQVSAAEARSAVASLVEMKLLKRNGDGTFSQTSRAVTGENLPMHLAKSARRRYIEMAIDASEKMKPCERNISAATIGLSEEKFREASEMIDAVRERIVAMAAEDQKADKIFQLNFQLFPLSRRLGKRSSSGIDEK